MLGLGFTTFILSYGVWALMGISLALGDPAAGLAIGIAFGVGRATPIILLAPIADRPSGERACEAMAMRTVLYWGARLGDALALALVAILLAGSVGAEAAEAEAEAAARDELDAASDPSIAGAFLAYENDDGVGELAGPNGTEPLPGTDPAIGGPWLAVIGADGIEVRGRRSGALETTVPVTDVDAVAVSRNWLAYRVRRNGRDRLRAVRIAADRPAAGVSEPVAVADAKGSTQLGAPAIDRDRVVYTRSAPRRSKLLTTKLAKAGKRRMLLGSRTRLHTAPSLAAGRIAYVLTTRKRQLVKVKRLDRREGRTVHRAKPGPPTLWSTALSADRVYFTVVERDGDSRILSTSR